MIISPPLLAHCAPPPPLEKTHIWANIFFLKSSLSRLSHRGAFASPPSWMGLLYPELATDMLSRHIISQHMLHMELDMWRILEDLHFLSVVTTFKDEATCSIIILSTSSWNVPFTAVSCSIQMKASGKQVFLSFRSYYPLYGYNHKSQKVYFYK